MGPIEITFLVLLIVSMIVGVVRGYAKELGVTTMLLIALFVLEFLNERYQGVLDRALTLLTGQTAAAPVRAWVFVIALIVIAFISYQGQTLQFPGRGNRLFFDIGTGLLNGYLLAGSIWYYLHHVGWPGLPVSAPFSAFYHSIVQLLPPAVFSWPYFIGLAVILLVARVWK